MQPHSMCAVALAGTIWNSPYDLSVAKCEMRVEYRKLGRYASHSYELTDVVESSDKCMLRMTIKRVGGGLACTIRLRRNSTSEGSEVTMEHDTIHVSGLREVFNLWKMAIKNGTHYNSLRYRNFYGEFLASDRKRLRLHCDVKLPFGDFVSVEYTLERVSLILS